jgi:serine/threonine protein kinase
MSSSTGKTDADFRLDNGDDALTFPAHAEPTDDSPTIISKTHPLVEPKPSGHDKITELNGKAAVGEGMVNGLRGRRLAHYELIEPIGVGGMAAVLRAHDTQLDRQVALKILPPEMAVDVENVQRFHQEAKAAARLDHENIARVFFCGEDQGLHFIAFEFVEGDNLRTLLERRRRLPVPEAVRYVLQIATGLEHASSRGVVHRDVKPSNIIVSPNGRAKLVDMGLARNMERREQDLTHSGVTLGTFDYLSPEQAMEPRDADARSDIYSLGCTFYHMLTGQPPVPEGTAAKKLHHHQHIDPVDPRQLNQDVPDEIALILGRMMAKDPKKRYQRPLQLVQHLMQVARKVGAADDLPEGALFVDTPLPTGPRSRPVLIVSVVGLALAAMIGLVAIGPGDYLPVSGPGPAVTGPDAPPKKNEVSSIVPEALVIGSDANSTGPSAVVRSAAGFAEQAKSRNLDVRKSLKISKSIALEEIGESVTFAKGDNLVIEPDASSYTGVSVKFKPAENRPTEGIVLTGGSYIFKNLTFQVDGAGDLDKAVAGIVVRSGTQVTFDKCSFEQKGMPLFNPEKWGVASVLVEHDPASGLARPRVVFSQCDFYGSKGEGTKTRDNAGQVAVAVQGDADVRATDCGFMPHGAFFHILSPSEIGKTAISLDHCSGLVLSGPVFRFKPKAGASLTAKHCLFDRYNNAIVQKNEPDFIRQLDSTRISYQGEANYFHSLNALWSIGDSIVNNMEGFRGKLAQGDYDKESIAPTLTEEKSPWYAPLPETLPSEKAFQVKPEYYGVYGLRKCAWGDLAATETPALKLANGVKLLDPEFKGKQDNVFDTLEKALVYLEPGDTLLIKPGKAGTPIEIPPTRLKLPLNLTIKAYEKTTPVLKLGKPLEKKDYAFFRALDGKLCFEGLHFLLDARTDGVNQSIVQLGDSVYCSFDRCVVTMKERNQPGTVGTSAIAFVDPKDLMRTEPRPYTTAVKITDSFIRGDGDLVKMTSCRPFKLSADNSVVAVSGSLIDLQAASGDDVDHGPTIALTRVSALTRDPVFSLRSFKNGKGLAKMTIAARYCLFAPIDKKPLFLLETPEVGGEDLFMKYVDWKERPNRFAKFDKLVEQERPNDSPVMMLDAERYKEMFGVPKDISDTPTMPPVADTSLAQESPASLRPMDPSEPFATFGATLDQLDALIKALK